MPNLQEENYPKAAVRHNMNNNLQSPEIFQIEAYPLGQEHERARNQHIKTVGLWKVSGCIETQTQTHLESLDGACWICWEWNQRNVIFHHMIISQIRPAKWTQNQQIVSFCCPLSAPSKSSIEIQASKASDFQIKTWVIQNQWITQPALWPCCGNANGKGSESRLRDVGWSFPIRLRFSNWQVLPRNFPELFGKGRQRLFSNDRPGRNTCWSPCANTSCIQWSNDREGHGSQVLQFKTRKLEALLSKHASWCEHYIHFANHGSESETCICICISTFSRSVACP